ncbi:putative sushi, von Willebrand factor type A [Apostichopus japonicus]|uniref:Putative sushi, von Willebrand factor type A n=1 Tax=Stichopus japonicus TaxID=307972 RepID=A0A2G8K647_STIJA|nr:putative sushi, von Willebrand factor type A [Apostichopus japonicus]
MNFCLYRWTGGGEREVERGGERGCEFFEAPENGNVIYDPVNRTVGSTATFSCSSGYVLSGNAHLECLETKVWNATNDVSCAQENYCDVTLVQVDNADVTLDQSTLVFGTVATISCSSGNVPIDGTREIQRSCLGNGDWSDGSLTCIPSDACRNPPEIENASRDVKLYYANGERLLYSCNPGYASISNSSLQCVDGNWTEANIRCKAVQCPALDTPVNGRKDGSGTGYNDRVEFSCDQGLSLHGESVLTCQGDGTWSADVPECTGSCDSTDLPYGDVNEDERTVQVIPLRELVGTLTRNGGYIRVKCPEGYEHRGSRYMKCQEGEWMPYRRPSLPGRPPLCINV